jgi:hypothetical protein
MYHRERKFGYNEGVACEAPLPAYNKNARGTWCLVHAVSEADTFVKGVICVEDVMEVAAL